MLSSHSKIFKEIRNNDPSVVIEVTQQKSQDDPLKKNLAQFNALEKRVLTLENENSELKQKMSEYDTENDKLWNLLSQQSDLIDLRNDVDDAAAQTKKEEYRNLLTQLIDVNAEILKSNELVNDKLSENIQQRNKYSTMYI